MSLSRLINELNAVYDESTSKDEELSNIILESDSPKKEDYSVVKDFIQCANELGVSDAVNFTCDESPCDEEELAEILSGNSELPTEWKLVVNKDAIGSAIEQKKSCNVVFFLGEEAAREWLDRFAVIDGTDRAFENSERVIILLPIDFNAFGGPRIGVFPLRGNFETFLEQSLCDVLPTDRKIREHVHVVSSYPLRVCPQVFNLRWGDVDSPIAKPFRVASAVTMCAALVDVLYGKERVTVKGVRHVDMALIDGSVKDVEKKVLADIEEAVQWVYDERVDTRKKLLADRLSLDSEGENNFVDCVKKYISHALSQSKDQYRFVILDRKDEYAKELRDLLKDLREQAEAYAEKTRSLVGGLLRDALAAFLFVGLALSVRVGSNEAFLLSDFGYWFFRALAFYFILAGIIQIVVAIRDVKLADEEMWNWVTVTRDYISESELKRYLEDGLSGRRLTFWVAVVFVGVLYSGLSVGGLFLSNYLQDMNADTGDRVSVEQEVQESEGE